MNDRYRIFITESLVQEIVGTVDTVSLYGNVSFRNRTVSSFSLNCSYTLIINLIVLKV